MSNTANKLTGLVTGTALAATAFAVNTTVGVSGANARGAPHTSKTSVCKRGRVGEPTALTSWGKKRPNTTLTCCNIFGSKVRNQNMKITIKGDHITNITRESCENDNDGKDNDGGGDNDGGHTGGLGYNTHGTVRSYTFGNNIG